MCVLSRFRRVQVFATLWTIAHQAPLSMGFSRKYYWNRLPWPHAGDLPNLGIESESLGLLYCQAGSLSPEALGSPYYLHAKSLKKGTNEITRQKLTHRHRKQTYGYQRGKGKVVRRIKLGVCN